MINPFSAVINGISSWASKREERKAAKETAVSKLNIAKVEGKRDLDLTDAEWESLSIDRDNLSWKDEYVTVVVTSPFVLVIIGSILKAFGAPEVLEGSKEGVEHLVNMGIDVGFLNMIVISAAVGIKIWRGFK